MIYINDKPYPFEQEQLLSDLFKSLKMDVSKGIAVALNNKVVPRSEWNDCKVNSNDKLLLIKATQGG
jgi:sulfur carrier protein